MNEKHLFMSSLLMLLIPTDRVMECVYNNQAVVIKYCPLASAKAPAKSCFFFSQFSIRFGTLQLCCHAFYQFLNDLTTQLYVDESHFAGFEFKMSLLGFLLKIDS